MASEARRTDPALWETVKAEITRGGKGGDPEQWSARKAQMAVQEYKKRGGGYEGRRSGGNSLSQWTREDWGTKSGARSRDSGERYLPKDARDHLSDADYRRTSDKKRADSRRGQPFSSQPKDVAEKTAPYRQHGDGETRAALYEKARRRNVPGRSRMSKEELRRAVT